MKLGVKVEGQNRVGWENIIVADTYLRGRPINRAQRQVIIPGRPVMWVNSSERWDYQPKVDIPSCANKKQFLKKIAEELEVEFPMSSTDISFLPSDLILRAQSLTLTLNDKEYLFAGVRFRASNGGSCCCDGVIDREGSLVFKAKEVTA